MEHAIDLVPQPVAEFFRTRDPRRPGEVRIAEVSRQFLKIEPVGATSAEGVRTYFGRTAFRPKALSAVTAPFPGRVTEVLVEQGQPARRAANYSEFSAKERGRPRRS